MLPYLQLAGSTTFTVELGAAFTVPSGYTIQPFGWQFTSWLVSSSGTPIAGTITDSSGNALVPIDYTFTTP